MYDHHAHVTWQQHERRITAAAERRRSNLERVERARAQAEPDITPKEVVDTAVPTIEASPQLATPVSC